MTVLYGLLRSAATMVVQDSLVMVVMSAKNASNGSSAVVLYSLLIAVKPPKNAPNVNSLTVLNSLLILVMSTANTPKANSPTTTTCLVQSATNASNVNSQTGRCSQVWHTFTCQKFQTKTPQKAKSVLAQSKDCSKPWRSVQTSSI